MKNYHPTLRRPHDVIQHTLRQTTQLAKSTIHYPMKRHLKSRFQMLRHKVGDADHAHDLETRRSI
jgi:hypothetical protein